MKKIEVIRAVRVLVHTDIINREEGYSLIEKILDSDFPGAKIEEPKKEETQERERTTEEGYQEKIKQVRDIVSSEGVSIKQAFDRLFDRQCGGTDYNNIRKGGTTKKNYKDKIREAKRLLREGKASNKKDAVKKVFGRDIKNSDYYWFKRKSKKRQRNKRTEEDYEKAFELVKKGMKPTNAAKKVFGYAGGATFGEFRKYIEGKTGEKGSRDKGRVRMSYIHGRIKSLTRDNKYDYAGAFRIASNEWREKGIAKKIKKPVPKILEDPLENKLLLDFVERAIETKEPLKFGIEGEVLKCETILRWRSVTSAVMLKQNQLNDYFGKKVRFVLQKDELFAR